MQAFKDGQIFLKSNCCLRYAITAVVIARQTEGEAHEFLSFF